MKLQLILKHKNKARLHQLYQQLGVCLEMTKVFPVTEFFYFKIISVKHTSTGPSVQSPKSLSVFQSHI